MRNSDSKLSPGTYITYDIAKVDTEGALNLGSGTFVAPQDGQYAFSFSCYTGKRTEYFVIEVVKNGSKKFLIADGNDRADVEGDNISYYWLEELVAGDSIRLKVYDGDYNALHSSSTNYIIFNGFRL